MINVNIAIQLICSVTLKIDFRQADLIRRDREPDGFDLCFRFYNRIQSMPFAERIKSGR